MVQFEDQTVLLFDVEWFDPMSVSVKKIHFNILHLR